MAVSARIMDSVAIMRQRATAIEIERHRLAGALRAIRDMGGMDAVRAVAATEIERLSNGGASGD